MNRKPVSLWSASSVSGGFWDLLGFPSWSPGFFLNSFNTQVRFAGFPSQFMVCLWSCSCRASGWAAGGAAFPLPGAGISPVWSVPLCRLACLGTAAFLGKPASQVSFPAPASSLGIVSHQQQQKTRPHQQLGAAPGLFFPSFLVTS